MLVRTKYDILTILKSLKLTGWFLWNNCVYYKVGHIIYCLAFSVKLTNRKSSSWAYKNYKVSYKFSLESKDVIYVLICKTGDNFYSGLVIFKPRIGKDKSDVENRM